MKIQIDIDDTVKLRDHNQALADTWNDILEKNAPPGVKNEKQYDLMKVVTVQAEGPKGTYLKICPENNLNNPAYFALIEDLKQHKGSITRQGYFVFLFDNQKNAGIKPSKR